MKKDRNCSGGMNTMPVYGVSMPMMMPPQPPTMMYSNPNYSAVPSYTTTTPTYSQNTMTNAYNNVEQQMNNMQQQINMLDSRISKLEGKTTSNVTNKYSDSNYYML